MLESFSVVARQVGILFALMSVGFVCNRTKLVTDASVKGMVNVLILIVTPCLIVHSFQERPFEPRLLAGLGWAFAFSVLSPALGMLAAHLFIRHADIRQRCVLKCSIVFSNAGFMGIPLEHALLGSDGVFYGVAYVVVFNLLFWSWALVQFCGSLKDVQLRTLFLNPGSIGVALGLPLFLFSWKLPSFAGTPVKMMADLNTPLAMIIIGYNLAQAKFGPVVRSPRAYVAGGMRLIVVPAVFLAIVYGLHRAGFSFDPKMAVAIVTAASAPAAALTSMFAVRYARDVSLSVGLVSATTLLSIVTMPLLVGLALWLFGVKAL
ncbi:MAG: AEC family transporter [Kiritimatiellia bacterium]